MSALDECRCIIVNEDDGGADENSRMDADEHDDRDSAFNTDSGLSVSLVLSSMLLSLQHYRVTNEMKGIGIDDW